MSLTWPWALAAMAVVPLLLVARWWLNRRRRRVAVRVSSVALIRAALPGRSLWRRRIPVVLFLGSLLLLAVGAARPTASVPVPSKATSIVLAIDVSTSMCSTDVQPNRITVAQEAAREFVRRQDGETRIGLVAFSGIAGLVVPPTTDQDVLIKAIDDLRTSRGTAIGLAILASIDAIAEINPDVAPSGVELTEEGQPPPPAAGEYEPDAIVVLTDGANTRGVEPSVAAAEAAARRLRVFTIGFGTTRPAPPVCRADQISGGGGPMTRDGDVRGFGGGGGRRALLIDEKTLNEVADTTGGKYFRAQDAEQLTDVLTDLPSRISVQREDVEITVWFVLGGALLVLTALGLSLWWNRSPGVLMAPARATTGPPARTGDPPDS